MFCKLNRLCDACINVDNQLLTEVVLFDLV